MWRQRHRQLSINLMSSSMVSVEDGNKIRLDIPMGIVVPWLMQRHCDRVISAELNFLSPFHTVIDPTIKTAGATAMLRLHQLFCMGEIPINPLLNDYHHHLVSCYGKPWNGSTTDGRKCLLLYRTVENTYIVLSNLIPSNSSRNCSIDCSFRSKSGYRIHHS